VRRLSDKELKDKKASENVQGSEKVQGIDNPVDEEDLLVTNPPPPRSMNASFKINSALSKSGTDVQYSSPKKGEKK
jgi:hypothetical protein